MTARKGKSKNIALFGHFDSSNFGNASTLQAILYNLKRFHPDAQVACISTGSEARLTPTKSSEFQSLKHLSKVGCLVII